MSFVPSATRLTIQGHRGFWYRTAVWPSIAAATQLSPIGEDFRKARQGREGRAPVFSPTKVRRTSSAVKMRLTYRAEGVGGRGLGRGWGGGGGNWHRNRRTTRCELRAHARVDRLRAKYRVG
jgi:hypothetical protein